MYSEMLTNWLRYNYIWCINFSRNFHYDLSFGQIEPVWPFACLSLNLMSLTHNFRTNWKYSRGISSYDMKWHKIVKTQFFIDRHFRFPSQKLWLRILLCIIACCVTLSLAFLLWPFTPHHKSASGSSYVEGHCLRSFTHPSITSQAALAWPLVELPCLDFPTRTQKYFPVLLGGHTYIRL